MISTKNTKNNWQRIGIGSFGPIDIHPNSATYGYDHLYSKKAWQNFDFIGYLNKNLKELRLSLPPMSMQLLTENMTRGMEKGVPLLFTIRFGTGIGGSALQNGIFVEGLATLKSGHMLVADTLWIPLKVFVLIIAIAWKEWLLDLQSNKEQA